MIALIATLALSAGPIDLDSAAWGDVPDYGTVCMLRQSPTTWAASLPSGNFRLTVTGTSATFTRDGTTIASGQGGGVGRWRRIYSTAGSACWPTY